MLILECLVSLHRLKSTTCQKMYISTILLRMMPQTRQDGKALALYAAAAMMGYRLQNAWASWVKHTTVRRRKHDKKRLAAASCCERRIGRGFQAFVVRQQIGMMHPCT